MWKLSVLCQFELRTPEGKEFVTRSSAARELLCILTLSGPAGVARTSLATHLFSDHQNPESSLNVLISRLRSALEAHSPVPLLQTTGHRLHLVNVEADVFRLHNALSHLEPRPEWVESALAVLDGHPTELVPGTYRSALVAGLRDDLCVRILATFASWVQSPHIDRWRPQLLRAVTLIQKHLPFNGITVERLLLIFGALGLKELLLKTFDDYEAFLENEFGERTPRNVGGLVEDLIAALDEQHREANRFPNFDARPLYGREVELRQLATSAQMPGVHVVAGHSGIGKTSLVQTFAASSVLTGLKKSWIDLGYEDEEMAFATVLSQRPDVLFVDHYTQRNAAFVLRIRQALGTAAIFLTCVSPAKVSATTILMLRPLSTLGQDASNPSLQLFLDRLGKYGGDPSQMENDYVGIVDLSEGIPYVIDMLARLTATAGPHASKRLLERWQATETAEGAEHVWPSLMIATRASIGALSPESQTALTLLARLDVPVATDLMFESRRLSTDGLEELFASGLVQSEDAGASIGIHGLSGTAVKSCTTQAVGAEAFGAFVSDLATAILKNPEPILAGSEASRKTAQALVNELVPTDVPLAIRLLEEVRHLLFAGAAVVLEESALRALLDRDDLSDEQFGTALLGYGAFHFSAARYAEMLDLIETRAPEARLLLLEDELCANILSQRALALRGLGRMSEALDLYLAALARARTKNNGRTVAKISYNIAMLYLQIGEYAQEGVGHLDEAISLMAHTPNQGAKIELLHTRALLMNAAGASLAEVDDELRAALCYGAQFGLTKQVAWIVQNMGLVHARHSDPGRAVVCEASGVHLAVGLPEGLSNESLRLIRSSLATLGASLQELGHFGHGVTCRSLMDRVGAYETCKLSEDLVESLQSKTFRSSVMWDEFPVTVEEIQQLCAQFFEAVVASSPELGRFFDELDAMSYGRLGQIAAGNSAVQIRS